MNEKCQVNLKVFWKLLSFQRHQPITCFGKWMRFKMTETLYCHGKKLISHKSSLIGDKHKITIMEFIQHGKTMIITCGRRENLQLEESREDYKLRVRISQLL